MDSVRAKILLLLLLPAMLSCRVPAVSLKDVTKEYRSKDYERLFETWTRHGEVYNLDTLENSLKVSATYLSWEMRQVYVSRYAYDYGFDETRRSEMLQKEREEFESNIEFVVAATATKQRWVEFHREDNPWQITLITSQGMEIFPTEIERVRKPSAMMIAYFPYITIYREVYLFRFSVLEESSGKPVLNPGLTSFSLVFAGALGRVELKWKVKKE
jgi:hypothetical protein